jgi:hypothetical protein
MNRHLSSDTTATCSDGLSRSVAEGVVRSLSGLRDIEAEIVDAARGAVSDTTGATHAIAGDLFEDLGCVVEGTIQATRESEIGRRLSLKGVAQGIVMGVSDLGGDVARAARQMVARAVREADAIGADTGAAAQKCIEGVVAGAREIDADVAALTRQSIDGAVAAAEAIGPAAVHSVEMRLARFAGEDQDPGKTDRQRSISESTPESRKTESESEQFPFY